MNRAVNIDRTSAPQGKSILIMAGGTGGHVFPALAIAKALQEKGYTVSWLGTVHGLENKVIAKTNIPFYTLPSKGLRRKSLFARLMGGLAMGAAFMKAILLMRRLRPNLVVGFGGYASVPGGVAAKIVGVPLVIHEQNALPGLANQFLAKFSKTVLTAFPNVLDQHTKVVVTGNPIRAEFKDMLQVPQQPSKSHALRILVLGGSLGAQALNQAVPSALKQLPAGTSIYIKHQCGREHEAMTQTAYAGCTFPYEIHTFLDPVADALAWADLVICRAGAMTISELSYCAKPSILVPYPNAVDDHQTHNARYLSNEGAAILIPQNQLNATTLANILLEFCQYPDKCYTMAHKAKALARPDATEQVVNECLRWIA
jgi:UDP-N-acetylglucosamine--N-acetylmuramyl-(pentapeptide) pyrophosphoryl-undecaprenol N-acetylglucosamine transferase